MTIRLYGAIKASDGVCEPAYDFKVLKSGTWSEVNGHDVYTGGKDYVPDLDIEFSNQNFYDVFQYDLEFQVTEGEIFTTDLETLRDRALLVLLKIRGEDNSYLARKVIEILAFCVKAKEYGATHVYAA